MSKGTISKWQIHEKAQMPEVEEQSELALQQTELLQKYEDYLISIARREMRTGLYRKFGTSDVVQQTFYRAVDNISDYRGTTEEQFRGWLRAILISQLRQNERDLLRDKRDIRRERPISTQQDSATNLVELFSVEPTDRNPTPCSQASAEEEDQRIQASLTMLPVDYQQVIHLRNWERLSFQQIGSTMNRTPMAVQKLYYRAILRLQQIMGTGEF